MDKYVYCIVCGKTPEQLSEYTFYAVEEDISPTQYVIENEGTYNQYNGHFTCTECYIKIGMPSSSYGWIAP